MALLMPEGWITEQNTVKFTQPYCSKRELRFCFFQTSTWKIFFPSVIQRLIKKNMHHPRVYGSNTGLHFKALKTPFYRSVAQKLHFSSVLMELRISPSHASHFLPLHLHHDIKFTTYIFLACFLSEKAHLFAVSLTGGKNCTWETPECHFLSFQGTCFKGNPPWIEPRKTMGAPHTIFSDSLKRTQVVCGGTYKNNIEALSLKTAWLGVAFKMRAATKTKLESTEVEASPRPLVQDQPVHHVCCEHEISVSMTLLQYTSIAICLKKHRMSVETF